MKVIPTLLLVVGLLAGITIASPVPILFDTDMDTDCDDVGAMAILHTLADRGEEEIATGAGS